MKVEAIESALTSVTKTYTTMRKREERARRSARRDLYMCISSTGPTLIDVAFEIMERVYNEVSSNGQRPAYIRQIMYRCRGEMLERTGEEGFTDGYFTQKIWTKYAQAHDVSSWDVVFDPRGNLTEPHTKKNVPLGTLDVRDYLRGDTWDDGQPDFRMSTDFPTKGPDNRFDALLFCEKEGFNPLFRQVKLAERWDIAIMSTKGQSVTAARDCILQLGLPTYVMHDFDKPGFSIFGAMKRGTERYPTPLDNVIDIGLRLDDVEKYGLLSEPFTSNDFIEWIESKLAEHGVKKIMPDDDTLEEAYRRAAKVSFFNGHIDDIEDAADDHAENITIPDDLGEQVRKGLKKDRHLPWDDVIAELVGQEADE